MRIQIVTNLYPPQFIGGYELGCQSVVNRLAQRGHQLNVLTSRYQLDRSTHEGKVHRLLYERFTKERVSAKCLIPLRERTNRNSFRMQLAEFRPDIVYFWSMVGISASLMDIALREHLPVVVYSSDLGLKAIYRSDYFLRLLYGIGGDPVHRLTRWFFRQTFDALGISTKLSALDGKISVQCTSQYIKDSLTEAGVCAGRYVVIPWGVRESFLETTPEPKHAGPVRILYTGQLADHKGVHTLISAYIKFRRNNPGLPSTLRIAGSAHHPEYEQHLRSLAIGTPDIEFLGRLGETNLRSEYQLADIYVFPSEWDEPFAISPLEAMASRLPIIATLTGGSKEIFVDGANSLVYPPGDINSLAHKIGVLASSPPLRNQLGESARQLILDKYTMNHMVDAIETDLANDISRKNIS